MEKEKNTEILMKDSKQKTVHYFLQEQFQKNNEIYWIIRTE